MEKSRLMLGFSEEDFPPSYFSVIQKTAKAANPPYPVTPESNPPYPVNPEFNRTTRVPSLMPKPMQIPMPMPSPSRNRNSVSPSGSEVDISTARQSPYLVSSLERNSPNYESFVMVPRMPRKSVDRTYDVVEVRESRNAEEKKKWIGNSIYLKFFMYIKATIRMLDGSEIFFFYCDIAIL